MLRLRSGFTDFDLLSMVCDLKISIICITCLFGSSNSEELQLSRYYNLKLSGVFCLEWDLHCACLNGYSAQMYLILHKCSWSCTKLCFMLQYVNNMNHFLWSDFFFWQVIFYEVIDLGGCLVCAHRHYVKCEIIIRIFHCNFISVFE